MGVTLWASLLEKKEKKIQDSLPWDIMKIETLNLEEPVLTESAKYNIFCCLHVCYPFITDQFLR